tara:strand:- start:305 stop:790 length:486 start_codon:yes stop_codon:yes gene_type:complete
LWIKLLRKKKINQSLLIFSACALVFILIFIFFSKNIKTNNLKNKTIETKLITNVHQDLPMKFETNKSIISLVPGKVTSINYSIENLSNETLVASATFQFWPNELESYLTKLNCFCYEEQTLKAGQKQEYPLVLLIDPKVAINPNTKDMDKAIIQFTFFKKQ